LQILLKTLFRMRSRFKGSPVFRRPKAGKVYLGRREAFE
jgi:hypothetical protein